jgi:hypothetical protein
MMPKPSSRYRPRYTPGGLLLPIGDGRRRAHRRYRDVAMEFERLIGGEMTEADKSLVALATTLTLQVESTFANRMAGIAVDEDQAVRNAGTLRRVVADIRARAEANKPAPTPWWQQRQADDGDDNGDD